MIYRAWDYRDIFAVSALEKECFAGERWTFQMFASSFTQETFFGELCETEENGEKKLVAYGCVQCALECADIMNIAVAPPYRRCGIGRTMIKRLVGGARRRGVKRLFLEVRKSNFAAQNLYVGEGFSVVSERKKYYPDGENALVMVKEL